MERPVDGISHLLVFFLFVGRRASVLFTLGGGGILAGFKSWVWPLSLGGIFGRIPPLAKVCGEEVEKQMEVREKNVFLSSRSPSFPGIYFFSRPFRLPTYMGEE